MKTIQFLASVNRECQNKHAVVLKLFVTIAIALVTPSTFAGSASWKTHPASNDWNTASNWTPETVPDGIDDVATFGSSNVTDVFMSSFVDVGGITFNPGADAYNINVQLLFTGVGIVNNSGIRQEITTAQAFGFAQASSAGSEVTYTVKELAECDFHDQSTAGSASFISNGSVSGDIGGAIVFFDRSSAADSIILNSLPQGGTDGGETVFEGNSSAGDSTVTIESLAVVEFFDNSTAANADLTNDGGTIYFEGNSEGGMAQFHLLHGGVLNVSGHSAAPLVLGSLDGDGVVTISSPELGIGSNGMDTIFSGLIEEGSGGKSAVISKVGTGTLTLSGANTYTGGTIVEAGTLLVATRKGSATGTGPVQVNGGTFGGRSNITGAVTIGSGSGAGAYLAPGVEGPGVLVIKNSLTFKSDGTYNCDLNLARSKADQVAAKAVTIESGAHFNLNSRGNQSLSAGTVFKVIDNRSRHPISGTFADLPDNSTLSIGSNTLRVSYESGDGNDLTLTVLP
jgi:autotransporter-associated beta strand protein